MRVENVSKAQSALWFGLFPSNDTTLGFLHDSATLSEVVEHPHVTFGYKIVPPSDIDWDAVYEVKVFAYGNDGENEGYAVSFPSELDEFYFGADTPHITLSTSPDGSPVNTAFIDFNEIEPFDIPMKFGFYMRGAYYV